LIRKKEPKRLFFICFIPTFDAKIAKFLPFFAKMLAKSQKCAKIEVSRKKEGMPWHRVC
jgi:hypothetical protein